MRHRRRLIFWGILIALAGIALVGHLRDPEPICHGHPLSYWVEFLDLRAPQDDTTPATDAIVQIGTNSLPFLLRWIQYEPSRRKEQLSGLLERIPGSWFRRLAHRITHPPSDRLAYGAYEAFCFLGPRAAPALEDLCRIMNATSAPQTSRRATVILGWIGTNALPGLLTVIQEPGHPNRLFAVGAVGNIPNIGAAAKLAVPALIACTRETNDEQLSLIAVSALGSLKAMPDLSVPALVSCLQSTDADLRHDAADALAKFGPQAIGAIPALTNALADSDRNVSDSAMAALNRIAPATVTNVPPRRVDIKD